MSPIHAKTAVLTETGAPFELRETELPSPAEGEVIVKTEMCTICGSDLHTIEGRRPLSGPMVLGHEIIGRIERLPAGGVSDISGTPLAIGDRITWSIHASCGECFWCQNGLSQKCERLFKYGHEPVTTALPATGGFGSHCQLQPGTAIVKVPETLDARIVCPANCATATVAAAFRQVDSCKGKCVLLLGAGMLGLTAVAWAREAGAESIVVVEPQAARGELATKFGASSVVGNLSDAQFEIEQLTSGRGADFAFEFSGHNHAVQAAIHFLRVGGNAVLVGSVFPSESIPISPEMIVRRWLKIHGVHNYSAVDLSTAVEFLVRNASKYPFAELVSQNFELTEIDSAWRSAAKGSGVRVAICHHD